ncbi:hypothetical protein ACFQHV_02505 [Promicromonospora thailandica]|nr:hypothetical protein [Promicromonospora thailandica]BFF16797.1 hypothetical protein GCM10025730_03180 [Promicromonospora thailandica]
MAQDAHQSGSQQPGSQQPGSRRPGHEIQAELEAAQQAVAEHRRLSGRLESARAALATAEKGLARATEALAGEAADVRRLEELSPTLIWATLRGDRDERLEAERAEQRAAEYQVAAARRAVAVAERESAVVAADLAGLGDVGARRDRALAAKESWVVGSGADGARELTGLAAEVGAARAELTEVREVVAAADVAGAALAGARKHLDSASGWAAYDTFGGGGFVADLVKREKMDQAVALMRTADEALHALARELGDLGRDGVGGIGVDGLSATFDVWLDDIFSDWSVMNRINEARDRVRAAQVAVGGVRQGAADRAAALEARLGELGARREHLLTGA